MAVVEESRAGTRSRDLCVASWWSRCHLEALRKRSLFWDKTMSIRQQCGGLDSLSNCSFVQGSQRVGWSKMRVYFLKLCVSSRLNPQELPKNRHVTQKTKQLYLQLENPLHCSTIVCSCPGSQGGVRGVEERKQQKVSESQSLEEKLLLVGGVLPKGLRNGTGIYGMF